MINNTLSLTPLDIATISQSNIDQIVNKFDPITNQQAHPATTFQVNDIITRLLSGINATQNLLQAQFNSLTTNVITGATNNQVICGTATIASGNTFVQVTFGITTPNTTYRAVCTPTVSVANYAFAITNKTTTTFRITATGVGSNVSFDWVLIY